MSLPLWDPITLPPNLTLVDINSLTPESKRHECQAVALELWITETGESVEDFAARDWSDDEGMFVAYDAAGDIVGIVIMTDVEDDG